MLWIAAAAIIASTPQGGATPPVVVQATATVRIISGVRIKLDSSTNADAPPAHDSTVSIEGAQRSARLIEFQ